MREGYWWSESESHLPMPQANAEAWPGKYEFLTYLIAAEAKACHKYWKRFSLCRCCQAEGKSFEKRTLSTNGSIDHRLGGWVWPDGFKHYVEVHNLRPSLAFQEFIIGHEVKSPESEAQKRISKLMSDTMERIGGLTFDQMTGMYEESARKILGKEKK